MIQVNFIFRTLVSLCTNLFPALEEESIRVHAITDSIANYWEPMEDNRRFIGILEKELAQDIEHN